jgi:hypothetical protein
MFFEARMCEAQLLGFTLDGLRLGAGKRPHFRLPQIGLKIGAGKRPHSRFTKLGPKFETEQTASFLDPFPGVTRGTRILLVV